MRALIQGEEHFSTGILTSVASIAKVLGKLCIVPFVSFALSNRYQFAFGLPVTACCFSCFAMLGLYHFTKHHHENLSAQEGCDIEMKTGSRGNDNFAPDGNETVEETSKITKKVLVGSDKAAVDNIPTESDPIIKSFALNAGSSRYGSSKSGYSSKYLSESERSEREVHMHMRHNLSNRYYSAIEAEEITDSGIVINTEVIQQSGVENEDESESQEEDIAAIYTCASNRYVYVCVSMGYRISSVHTDSSLLIRLMHEMSLLPSVYYLLACVHTLYILVFHELSSYLPIIGYYYWHFSFEGAGAISSVPAATVQTT